MSNHRRLGGADGQALGWIAGLALLLLGLWLIPPALAVAWRVFRGTAEVAGWVLTLFNVAIAATALLVSLLALGGVITLMERLRHQKPSWVLPLLGVIEAAAIAFSESIVPDDFPFGQTAFGVITAVLFAAGALLATRRERTLWIAGSALCILPIALVLASVFMSGSGNYWRNLKPLDWTMLLGMVFVLLIGLGLAWHVRDR